MFKVDNRSPWRSSGVFIFNFECIGHVILVCLFFFFFADFEHGNGSWNTLLPESKFICAFHSQI